MLLHQTTLGAAVSDNSITDASDNISCCCIRQQWMLLYHTTVSAGASDKKMCCCIRQQWVVLYQTTVCVAASNNSMCCCIKQKWVLASDNSGCCHIRQQWATTFENSGCCCNKQQYVFCMQQQWVLLHWPTVGVLHHTRVSAASLDNSRRCCIRCSHAPMAPMGAVVSDNSTC